MSAAVLLLSLAHAEASLAPLDDMAAPGLWRALSSDGVEARLEPITAAAGPALRLDYDFQHHAGYAAVERRLPLDLPENFEIDLTLSGHGPRNDLEFKLIDASGDNVWWYRRPSFELGANPQKIRIKRRQIEFAWGPASDKTLHRIERLQLVISASSGGSGSFEIGAIFLRPLPPVPAAWPAPSARSGNSPAAVPDGSTAHAWRCRPAPAAACELQLDWQGAREFGGVRLDWDKDARPARYEIALSTDGLQWQTVRRFEAARGKTDRLWLPEAEARYLRIRLADDAPASLLLAVTLEPPAYGASLNSLVADAARGQPRGDFPRGFSEQVYWTLVGTDGGSDTGLLSEDGAIETMRGGASLEPFVVEDGRVFGWAQVSAEQSLKEGYLPLPQVKWTSPHWSLKVSAVAQASAAPGLFARYDLHNSTGGRLRLRLVLALRPYQVNPPAQFLTTPGGVAPIRDIEWDGRSFLADQATRIVPLEPPTRVGASAFESHQVPEGLSAPGWGGAPSVPLHLADGSRLASGAMAFDVSLAPGETKTIGALIPWGNWNTASESLANLRDAEHAAAHLWRSRLNRASIAAPDSPEAAQVAAALRTAEAHILISRNGPMLRPGTRSYARSWIRDGAMMSAALLRLDERKAAEDYLRWYSSYLFPNGKVPCCVDARGADPVPEHDSSGEFIYLAAEVYRLGGDRSLVQKMWPQFLAAIGYLQQLRDAERARFPQDSAFSGLLPPSISHEGYSAKPMHSYWDDFWALRGYEDAAFLADALGHEKDALELQMRSRKFAAQIRRSLEAVSREKNIDFIPGAADLGDFDATSTTIALAPGVERSALPPALLQSTFERYWQNFVARRDGTQPWQDYVPYEWRNVGAFVRLGWRARAHELLRYFMAARRPEAWNQWPEVIGRLPREARFIGDLPHGWVASDFIRSALDMFAYERQSDESLVLAAGLPLSWLTDRGIAVSGIRTRFGKLAFSLRYAGGELRLWIPAGMRVPPGGFLLPLPAGHADRKATVNGRAAMISEDGLRLRSAPCQVRVAISPDEWEEILQ